MKKNIADLRVSYQQGSLRKAALNPDPYKQFSTWFEQATTAGVPEPNAMMLSTSTRDGRPSSRMVLLKDFSEKGFSFFTNFNSRKGSEMEENPHVSLLFYWGEPERQVRIEGIAVKLPDRDADEYFRSRPAGHQIGAWVSEQSSIILSRKVLDERLLHYQAAFGQGPVPRPPHWGGYIVQPMVFEFWQGGENRLHDRFRYTKLDTGWVIDRLAP